VPPIGYDWKNIGCIWVFCKKGNEQYKVKLIAKRYSQKIGIDYNKIFSPVVKVKAQQKRKFDMKGLGEVKKILGMNHSRQRFRQMLAISSELRSEVVEKI